MTEDPQELITTILDWAEENPQFDSTFVADLQESLDEYGSLKPAQVEALKNIIDKWEIE